MDTKTTTLSEIAREVSAAHDLTVKKATDVVDHVRDIIVDRLAHHGRVAIFGLGAFEARATKEKTGRNPKTGEPVKIPAGHRVAFKPAKGLKDRVNK